MKVFVFKSCGEKHHPYAEEFGCDILLGLTLEDLQKKISEYYCYHTPFEIQDKLTLDLLDHSWIVYESTTSDPIGRIIELEFKQEPSYQEH